MTQQVFKWTKRLILVLAIIPILLFLAFAAAVNLIDFNQYKPQIEQEIGALTGRELQIEGAVDVSVLPFMLQVGKLSLKNPQGFPEENLLTLNEARIELSLAELMLDKKLTIISLELIKPTLHFYQTKEANNWQGIPLLESAAKKADTKTNNWFLQSLVIQDGEVTYKNTQRDFSTQIKQLSVITFDVAPNKQFKANSDFVFEHSQSPRKFEFELNTQLKLENDYTQIHLSDWSGVFKLQLPKERNLPDIRLNTSGKNLLVDFKYQQIYVHKALLNGLSSEVLTSFQGGFGVNPVYNGEFTTEKVDLAAWLEHMGLPKPSWKNADNPESIDDLVKEIKQKGSKQSGTFWFNWNGEELTLQRPTKEVVATKIEKVVEPSKAQ